MRNWLFKVPALVLAITTFAVPLYAQTEAATDSAAVLEWVHAAQALQASELEADSDSALALLHRAVAAAPAHELVLDELVQTYLRRGLLFGHSVAWRDTAAVYAQRLAEHHPSHGLALLGLVYGRKGEHALAVETLERATQHDSTHVFANVQQGSRYFNLGRHDKAIPVLARALRYDSLNVTALLMSGYAYFHLGMPNQAEAMVRRALAIDTTEWTVGGLMLSQLSRRDYPAAIAFTEDLWRADTTVAWRWARAGEAHLFARNFAEAEYYFTGAVERDSASYNNYVGRVTAGPLAYLRRRAGNEEGVSELLAYAYSRAYVLQEQGGEPWNRYYLYAAFALFEGDRDRAIRWLMAAHQAGMPGPVLIETDPLFDDLRGDPAFEEILTRLRWRVRELQARLNHHSTEG